MLFSTLTAFCAGLALGTTIPSKSFTADFDTIPGSGLVPEVFLIPTGYKGLAWPGFNVYNTSQAVTAIKPYSLPNFAASVTAQQAAQGAPSMITIAGTSTKAFDVKNTYDACVVASQTGLVSQSCTIKYTGTTVLGKTVSTTCTFTADTLNLKNQKPTLCTFPSSFKGLKSVSVVPIKATLTPLTTVVFLDSLNGTIYT